MLAIPNFIIDKGEYYISYNGSEQWYGSDTTALVVGQMQAFYILNGDHRKEYEKLNDFESCLAYFMQNIKLKNKHSELPKNI